MRSSMVSSSLSRLPTVDELGPDPEPLGLRADVLIARLDSDHDGKISLAEAHTAMMAMFDRTDTNHDGVVSPEERAAAMAQMQSQGQPAAQPAPAEAPQPH